MGGDRQQRNGMTRLGAFGHVMRMGDTQGRRSKAIALGAFLLAGVGCFWFLLCGTHDIERRYRITEVVMIAWI